MTEPENTEAQPPRGSKADVAKRFGVHEMTVHRWIDRGWLGCIKAGRMVRILPEHEAAFVARMQAQANKQFDPQPDPQNQDAA